MYDQKKYTEETVKRTYANLNLSSRQKLLRVIDNEANKQLATVHRQLLDSEYKTPVASSAKIYLSGWFSCDSLCRLNDSLATLRIPVLARYSLVAIGASIEASLTIPASQLIAAIISLGAAVVLAYYWSDLEPIFNQIVDAFKQIFQTIVDMLEICFELLKLNICYSKISFKEAILTESTRKHLEESCVNTIRKTAPVNVYYSSRNKIIMAIFEVPKGLQCWVNNSLDTNSTLTKRYDRKIDLTGYKLLVLYGFSGNNVNQVFHAHLRWGGKIDREIEFYRYKEKMTYRVIPLPILYESIFENGYSRGINNPNDQLNKN